MNKLKRGAEILTKEVNRLKELEELRDTLEEVGGLKQLADESASRIEGMKAQEKAAKAALDRAVKAADALQVEVEREAARIIDEAKAKAKQIESKASAEADRALHAAQAKVSAAEARAKQLQKDNATAEQELTATKTDIASAKRQLTGVNNELAKLRQRIA